LASATAVGNGKISDGEANGVSFVSLAIMSGVSSGLSVDTLFANGQIDTHPVTD